MGRAVLRLYAGQDPAARRPARPHARAGRARRLEEVTLWNRPTVGVVYRQGSGTWPQCGALTMRRKLSPGAVAADRKSTRLNSSHRCISYAVFCLKKKTRNSLLL